jgi:hypothetical protein
MGHNQTSVVGVRFFDLLQDLTQVVGLRQMGTGKMQDKGDLSLAASR